jgi:hypothetical protein
VGDGNVVGDGVAVGRAVAMGRASVAGDCPPWVEQADKASKMVAVRTIQAGVRCTGFRSIGLGFMALS